MTRLFLGAIITASVISGLVAAAASLESAEALMRGGRYAEAVREWDEILRAMPPNAPHRSDLENRRTLYAALADVPPQGVETAGDRSMTLIRNPLGTWNATVELGNHKAEWIVDTGANLSTLTQSEADAMGLQTRETGAFVWGSTDAKNPVRVAVAPEIRLGPARVTHVVFLVVPDESLYIPPLQHRIRGILGMPVLKALGAFSVAADGGLRLEPLHGPSARLTFDGWSVIVEVAHGSHTLRLLLDTGANVSALYPSSRAMLTDAERGALVRKEERTGGAGGLITRTTDVVPSFKPQFGRTGADLRNIRLLPDAPEGGSDGPPRHGVLGIDALNKGFAIDFTGMRIRVF